MKTERTNAIEHLDRCAQAALRGSHVDQARLEAALATGAVDNQMLRLLAATLRHLAVALRPFCLGKALAMAPRRTRARRRAAGHPRRRGTRWCARSGDSGHGPREPPPATGLALPAQASRQQRAGLR
jgi:hypothetical protein